MYSTEHLVVSTQNTKPQRLSNLRDLLRAEYRIQGTPNGCRISTRAPLDVTKVLYP